MRTEMSWTTGLLGAAALILFGCASHTGIVPMGGDVFVTSKQAATGVPGLGTLKADHFARRGQEGGEAMRH